MRHIFLFLLLFQIPFLSQAQITSIKLWNLDNKKVNIHELDSISGIVFVFLGPECPLSQNYTKQINDLKDKFSSRKIEVIAVFAGMDYDKDELKAFKENYNLQSRVLIDKKYKLARALEASVTPEAFLYSTKKNEVVYSGAIDNWVIQLGKQRKEITATYLEDAIMALFEGKDPEIKRIKPIGCFLEIK